MPFKSLTSLVMENPVYGRQFDKNNPHVVKTNERVDVVFRLSELKNHVFEGKSLLLRFINIFKEAIQSNFFCCFNDNIFS